MRDAAVFALPQSFDQPGVNARWLDLPSGRRARIVDEGDPSWPALLFLGGAGTSVQAFGLTEFARSLREALRIRAVSVERNGLGRTPYDERMGPAEHADLVWEALDRLGVPDVAVVAISGGGPYAAHVAAARPEQVRSLHLLCAYSDAAAGALGVDVDAVVADPVAWWRFPEDSVVHRIPGFIEATVVEAHLGFPTGDPRGLRHALDLYRADPLPDLSAVTAPAFLVWGDADGVVPAKHLWRWQQALPHVRLVRRYPDEGHDVQYRHWDQVLCDVIHLGARTLMSDGVASFLVPAGQTARWHDEGWGLGAPAWFQE